jgi:hypothetical protein
MNRYKGAKNVFLELAGYAVEISFDIVYNSSDDYDFEIDTMQVFKSDTDELVPVSVSELVNGAEVLKLVTAAVDTYIAQYSHDLLIDLAEQDFLAGLDEQAAQDRVF